MQPIDIAEKWARAAYTLWSTRDTNEPDVATLQTRVRAHYGSGPMSLMQIQATATVEAMNEWQKHKAAQDS